MAAVASRCFLDQVRKFGFTNLDSGVDRSARPHHAFVHGREFRGPLILSRVAEGPFFRGPQAASGTSYRLGRTKETETSKSFLIIVNKST